MSKLNDEMKALMTEEPVCVMATADSSGIPNAVPIHYTDIIGDDRIMLVDNFMNKTLENIRQNPNVSISVWHAKTGFQFKGKAVHETSGANFEAGVALVKKEKPEGSPKGVVVVEIDSVYSTSPGPGAGDKLA